MTFTNITSGEQSTCTCESANRLTSVDGVGYTWDENGNLLDDGVRTYDYDYANRLIAVVSGTLTTTYTYNGDGHRVAKTQDGVTTSYVVAVLGLSQVLVETTGGDSIVYLYGHDLLGEKDDAWQWHLGDGLGSVRQLADSGGSVSLAQGYTPFGVPLWSQGTGSTGYGFTGERWEAYSELLFLRARYYEPRTGRFVSKDLWSGNPQRPISFNLYLYAFDNPVAYADPSGFAPWDPLAEWLHARAESCFATGDLECVWSCYWGVAVGGSVAGYKHASGHLLQFLYKWGDLEYLPPASLWVSSYNSVQQELPSLEQDMLRQVHEEASRGKLNGHLKTRSWTIVPDSTLEPDLYYAMNAFQLWIETAYEIAWCAGCDYEVTVEPKYHFYDDYDWHKGLGALGPAAGVAGFKDEWAAALDDAGLALEFKVFGFWLDWPSVKAYTFPSDWLASTIPPNPISVKPSRW